MTTDSVISCLNKVDDALDNIDTTASPLKNFDALSLVMKAVFELGLARQVNPSAFQSDQVRQRLSAQGARFFSFLHLVDYYVSRLERQFWGVWEGRWIDVCFARSGLEFLLDLYQETAFSETDDTENGATFDKTEFEDLDAGIQQLQSEYGGVPAQQIPAGIPVSHWWWY